MNARFILLIFFLASCMPAPKKISSKKLECPQGYNFNGSICTKGHSLGAISSSTVEQTQIENVNTFQAVVNNSTTQQTSLFANQIFCPLGYYYDIYVQSCKPADRGYYSPSNDLEQHLCEPGYYNDLLGQHTCKVCSNAPLHAQNVIYKYTGNPMTSSSDCVVERVVSCFSGWTPSSNGLSCEQIESIQISTVASTLPASPCGAGKYLFAGVCQYVGLGRYSPSNDNNAYQCPSNSYSDIVNGQQCKLCINSPENSISVVYDLTLGKSDPECKISNFICKTGWQKTFDNLGCEEIVEEIVEIAVGDTSEPTALTGSTLETSPSDPSITIVATDTSTQGTTVYHSTGSTLETYTMASSDTTIPETSTTTETISSPQVSVTGQEISTFINIHGNNGAPFKQSEQIRTKTLKSDGSFSETALSYGSSSGSTIQSLTTQYNLNEYVFKSKNINKKLVQIYVNGNFKNKEMSEAITTVADFIINCETVEVTSTHTKNYSYNTSGVLVDFNENIVQNVPLDNLGCSDSTSTTTVTTNDTSTQDSTPYHSTGSTLETYTMASSDTTTTNSTFTSNDFVLNASDLSSSIQPLTISITETKKRVVFDGVITLDDIMFGNSALAFYVQERRIVVFSAHKASYYIASSNKTYTYSEFLEFLGLKTHSSDGFFNFRAVSSDPVKIENSNIIFECDSSTKIENGSAVELSPASCHYKDGISFFASKVNQLFSASTSHFIIFDNGELTSSNFEITILPGNLRKADIVFAASLKNVKISHSYNQMIVTFSNGKIVSIINPGNAYFSVAHKDRQMISYEEFKKLFTVENSGSNFTCEGISFENGNAAGSCTNKSCRFYDVEEFFRYQLLYDSNDIVSVNQFVKYPLTYYLGSVMTDALCKEACRSKYNDIINNYASKILVEHGNYYRTSASNIFKAPGGSGERPGLCVYDDFSNKESLNVNNLREYGILDLYFRDSLGQIVTASETSNPKRYCIASSETNYYSQKDLNLRNSVAHCINFHILKNPTGKDFYCEISGKYPFIEFTNGDLTFKWDNLLNF